MRRLVSAISLAVVVTVASARAHAQDQRALAGIDVELAAGRNLDPYNSTLFGAMLSGALGLEVNLHPVLGIHVAAAASYFTGDQSPTGAWWLGGRAGLRAHWGILLGWRSSDGWVDAHFNLGESDSIFRSGFDVGAGASLAIVHGLRVGPFARFSWQSDPRGENPMWLQAGLTVGILGDPRTAQPSHDADHDAVLDVDDHCPTEPAGARPDPQRRGCPARDGDGDGVFDADDVCPTQPAGARPDPRRLGCPLLDTDGDGVFDNDDQCPTEPVGARPDPAHPGCPGTDRDGDGVFDRSDLCPDQPAGRHPDAARPGCPLPDRDGDTVVDPEDHCPDQPGAPSTDPAHNGCPGLVRIDQSQIRIMRPVFFATGRDVILDASFPVLAAVADALQASGITRLRVEGHTDNRGNRARNLLLSQRRADSVRRWLTAHGIAGDGVEAQGLGDARPIEDNGTPLGRAANRRVEFHILQAASAAP